MYFNNQITISFEADFIIDGKPSKRKWRNPDLADGFYVIATYSYDSRETWYGPVPYEQLLPLQSEILTAWQMSVKDISRDLLDTIKGTSNTQSQLN